MSNLTEWTRYLSNLGDKCPPVAPCIDFLRTLEPDLPPVVPLGPGYTVVDAENGLVKFDGQESIPYWGERSFTFEGAKSAFDHHSKAWNTTNINCGNAQYASTHDFFLYEAVLPCIEKTAPGTTNSYWGIDEKTAALANTKALPNRLTDPADALTFLRTLPVPNTTPNNDGFHA